MSAGIERAEWADADYVAHAMRTRDGVTFYIQVRRRDGKPIREWRALQRIKNELAGRDVTAIEVFPPADEVIDTTNSYHLWCAPPGFDLEVSLNPGRRIRELGVSTEAAAHAFRVLNTALHVARTSGKVSAEYSAAARAVDEALNLDSVREP
jgi:hypothetical protein